MKLFKRNIVRSAERSRRSPTPLREKRSQSTLSRQLWQFTGSAILNLVVFALVAAYLSPLLYMFVTSVKIGKQLEDIQAPLYPAVNPQYNYKGVDYSVMGVPIAGEMKEWALITPRRTYAEFIDPQNPGAGLIHWDGNWRALKKIYKFNASFEVFTGLWSAANIPLVMINTLLIAAISEIGVLLSSIAVAYGFSRFRIPGGKWLFFLLISTILIPDIATLIPTYLTFTHLINWLTDAAASWQLPFSIPWVWLPLIAPHFFSSAILVFLLRQNFRSIPRDLDEAAMLDGAGPLRILIWVILPQSIPVIATVAMLHFFYIWNEIRHASLYLGTSPALQTISFKLQSAPTLPGVSQEATLQASALLLLIVPAAVLFIFQRFFMQDMVVTGQEK
ncbi:MAG: carbohydrate ABC transporter permease [Anaerolineales bacterium]